MSLLAIENLSVAFHGQRSREPVVREASLTLDRGQMLALVGESGSGKSVTALSIMQLHAPGSVHYPSGSILFDGEEMLNASEEAMQAIRGKRMGFVFQEPMSALNPLHTIGKQIAEIIRNHKNVSTEHINARVIELLEMVGLGHFARRLDAYPHQLSGGERQRVVIAMAIANEPELLIADEPTTALDVSLQMQIISLLKQLQKQLNMAVLLITHDLVLVKKVADKIAIMQQGEIVEQGITADIFANPGHAYTQHLLTSGPSGSPPPLQENAELVMECENLSIHFPTQTNFWGTPIAFHKAVDGISLSVHRGETLGIVGESGSGKTTLGLGLLRLIKSSGRIVFLGENLSDKGFRQLRRMRRHMQFVFQDPYSSLNPRMTIAQIVGEGLRVHHPEMDRAARNERVAHILHEVGLDREMMSRYPHEFSGGQRQRISIARAMILEPELVVLDEPTSALDVSLQAQMIELLHELQAKHRTSYLFISHDLKVIRAISHRILVLQGGHIIEEGQTESLFNEPKHAYTRQLVRAASYEDIAL